MKLSQDLQDAFVSISKISDNEISAEFCFQKKANIFQGHFPGQPILPGIMQIEMSKLAVEKSTNQEYSIRSVKKTKFSEQIKPGDIIYISITLTREDKGNLNVKAVLKVSDKVVGKVIFTLANS